MVFLQSDNSLGKGGTITLLPMALYKENDGFDFFKAVVFIISELPSAC